MQFRRRAAAAAWPLLGVTICAHGAGAPTSSIIRELPSTSALCVICNNVAQLDQRITRLERRITGRQPQFDEFTALKMVLGPYWNISAPMAWVMPSPAKGKILELRQSVVILQTTNTAKFIASLKNGAARGGITPARIEGTPAFIATRGVWTFISASRSALKMYLQAKSHLTLPGHLPVALRHADIAVEADTHAIRKELVDPSKAMLFSAMPGNPLPVGSPALKSLLQQIGNKLSKQLSTDLNRSLLTLHFGRQALIVNLTNAFHAHSPMAQLVAAQPPLPAHALAGLPDQRYFSLYADSIDGPSVAKWLKTLLPAKVENSPGSPRHKRSTAIQEFPQILAAVADHTGAAAIGLPPSTPSSAGRGPLNHWGSGSAIIIMHCKHPTTEMHDLAGYFSHLAYVRTKTAPPDDKNLTHSTLMGYQVIRIVGPTQKPIRTSPTVELINMRTHGVLLCVGVPHPLLKSAVTAAGNNLTAVMKRPGLTQTLARVVPGSFLVAYLPIARWTQQQNAVPTSKAANALALGLPPPPAVVSVGAGGKSLVIQVYIPVATLEQSLSGNPAGALF